ncbi:MAG: hypothetical protein ACLFP1_01190 [Candidatus Goldiibacteriota bacterium]
MKRFNGLKNAAGYLRVTENTAKSFFEKNKKLIKNGRINKTELRQYIIKTSAEKYLKRGE